MITAVFIAAAGLGAVAYALTRRRFRVGPIVFGLSQEDGTRIFFVAVAIVLADAAAQSISLSNAGTLTPGDFRASQWFVVLNLLIIFVVAPLVALASLLSIWRSRRRR